MKGTLSLLVLATAMAAHAQNLVPNGSFEHYSLCPDDWGQIDRANDWTSYRGSPDYFNGCSQTGQGVPLNGFGHSLAATGQGYVGVLTWRESLPNGRELFGAPLTTPLAPGVPVYVSFKVKAATNGTVSNTYWSANGMGLRFTMMPYVQLGIDPLPNSAVVYMVTAPLDTSAWMLIEGTYIPDSAYAHVVLGNFFDDSMVSPVVLNEEGFTDGAYVFVDDVCVALDPADCPFSTQIPSYPPPKFLIAPNPSGDQCEILFQNPIPTDAELRVYNELGQEWQRTVVPQGQVSWSLNLRNIPAGVYFLRLSSPHQPPISVALLHVSP